MVLALLSDSVATVQPVSGCSLRHSWDVSGAVASVSGVPCARLPVSFFHISFLQSRLFCVVFFISQESDISMAALEDPVPAPGLKPIPFIQI